MLPAKDFEAFTGVSGISRTYVMRNERDPEEIDQEMLRLYYETRLKNYLTNNEAATQYQRAKIGPEKYDREKPHFLALLRKHVYDIVTLNPELGDIGLSHESVSEMYHFIRGAVSGFNPQDIEYFLELNRTLGGSNTACDEQKEVMNLVAALWDNSDYKEKKIGSWKMAPSTANTILGQLHSLYANKIQALGSSETSKEEYVLSL
ncbi:MAG: hypothetical protein GC137_08545 [Alphaproteobacteria bacterium]|nr:hypothetical protein [Alphaproteobacteria bacterium]